jgi:hypothetical protein
MMDMAMPGSAPGASANGAKMYGKWGRDIFERLDSAIVLSREGRYLPDDGDTSAWLAAGPRPEEFPRRAAPLGASHRKVLDDLYLSLAAPDGADGSLLAFARAHLERGRQLIAKGFFIDVAAGAALPDLEVLSHGHLSGVRSGSERISVRRQSWRPCSAACPPVPRTSPG